VGMGDVVERGGVRAMGLGNAGCTTGEEDGVVGFEVVSYVKHYCELGMGVLYSLGGDG